MTDPYKVGMSFEAEVRRMAEALWNVPPGTCQPQRYLGNKDVGEVDGVVRLRDITHLIMATTETRLRKMEEDVSKLLAAKKQELREHPENQVAMWAITKFQLDALIIKHARDHGVATMTLHDFARRFFDGAKYLLQRRTYYFGSAANPEDGAAALQLTQYVSPTISLELRSNGKPAQESRNKNEHELLARLKMPQAIIVAAPFGAGKSFTGYTVFSRLSEASARNDHPRTPVFFNLRDHWGHEYAEMVLEAHARKIGFAPAEDLVRAWRAGLIDLMLDGFDEIASQVIAKVDDKRFMRKARAESLKGVRELIQKSPPGIGIMVSGRDHYFDDLAEMEHALGLSLRSYTLARIEEFSETQAAEFMKKHGAHTGLPDWLPRKPLLLGYLAKRGLLREILHIDGSEGFGRAWDAFIDLVCKREAELASSTMDAVTLRLVLHTLASKVRTLVAGTGPISELDLAEAYKSQTGQSAAGAVLAQLQRLPGLTERGAEIGLRSFVDEDMLAALQGGSLAHSILNNVDDPFGRSWLGPLSQRGVEMAAHLLKAKGFTADALVSKCSFFVRHNGPPQLIGDLLSIAIEMAREQDILDCKGLRVADASFDAVDLDTFRVDNLELHGATINDLRVGEVGVASTIRIVDSLINKISGVSNRQSLPIALLSEDCQIEKYDAMSTNSAVVHSNMPNGMKALLTVLRKLYLQAGGGRRLGALERGLPEQARNKVPAVVDELLRHGLVTKFSNVVHPVRRHTSRVHAILSAPMISADPLAAHFRTLQ